MSSLTHTMHAPLTHLRNLNPHIVAALSKGASAATHDSGPGFVMPRLTGGAALRGAAVGISAFAFMVGQCRLTPDDPRLNALKSRDQS